MHCRRVICVRLMCVSLSLQPFLGGLDVSSIFVTASDGGPLTDMLSLRCNVAAPLDSICLVRTTAQTKNWCREIHDDSPVDCRHCRRHESDMKIAVHLSFSRFPFWFTKSRIFSFFLRDEFIALFDLA